MGFSTGTVAKIAEIMVDKVQGKAGASIVEIERALHNEKVTPFHLYPILLDTPLCDSGFA